MDLALHLLIENSVFVIIATGFLLITGWAWREVQPFKLPKPLPGWFRYWFGSVQVLGLVPPLIALGWCIQHNHPLVWVWAAYFIVLALQVLSEWLTLRRFQSVVWVMVPYLYVPYRLWQLYEGVLLGSPSTFPPWMTWLLIGEIGVWGVNYLLDLAQLPRLLQWPGSDSPSSL